MAAPGQTDSPSEPGSQRGAATDKEPRRPEDGTNAEERRVARRVAVTALLLAAAAVIGVVLVFRFVASERERDLLAWQTKLGLIADSRAAAVEEWVGRQFEEIRELSQNPSVQLFVTELDLAGGNIDAVTEAEAQLEYLQVLLVVTADRMGFTGPVLGPDVRANVTRQATAGLVLLGWEGRVLASTSELGPIDLPLDSIQPEGGLIDLHLGADGMPALGFFVPIFAVQDDPASGEVLGYVVGVKRAGAELYGLLSQPGNPGETLESVLIRRAGASVEYLSPLADGASPLTKGLAADTPALAAGFAVDQPGGFASRRDYRGREVLATSRALADLPWTLLVKIDQDEALAVSEARLTRLLVVLLLAVALVALAMLTLWRDGASRRAERAARLYRRTAEALEGQRNLLRLVTDSQPTSIFIVDEKDHYRFANKVAADEAGVAKSDLLDKDLPAVKGPAAAQRYIAFNRMALEGGAAVQETSRLNGTTPERIVISDHIPIEACDELPKGVLVVERDITAEVSERERRERTLDHLVDSLLGVVDSRDPNAATHSRRVGRMAAILAEEMGLDDQDREAARVAGALMNFGKILVPRSLLSKDGALNEEELQSIRASMCATADLLADVEFDGPVIECLHQALERVDGRGSPQGLEGDQILLPARIIATANAFVGMVSERAYRRAIDLEDVLTELNKESGKTFDPGVVAALVNYVRNKGSRDEWQPHAST